MMILLASLASTVILIIAVLSVWRVSVNLRKEYHQQTEAKRKAFLKMLDDYANDNGTFTIETDEDMQRFEAMVNRKWHEEHDPFLLEKTADD